MTPRASVRLQFSRDFTIDDAVDLVPYFRALGISHLYAAPLLTARAGSTHGYDVVDPTEINPELGGTTALLRLSRALERHEMGLILDIVPNHMAADSSNPWWWDVLLWGPASRYAAFFDIGWQDPDAALQGKILLPVLGDSLEACLGRGELRLEADEEAGLFVCRYFDQRFPLDPRCYAEILDRGESGWDALIQQARHLEEARADDRFESAARKLRSALADRLRVARPGERKHLLAPFNEPRGALRLQTLLARQNYVLTPWQDAAKRINWRRFFDINGLVALRIDREEVFTAYHRLILELVRDGIVDGVRVDHVDGLADPAGYCRSLRAALESARPDRDIYFVVEKILDQDETLDTAWPVQGTTGYDFMDQVALVLHDPAGEAPLTALWRDASGDPRSFAAVAHAARGEILERLFPKQLDRALDLLPSCDSETDSCRAALVALLTAMRRYRTYGDNTGMAAADSAVIDRAYDAAAPTLEPAHRGALKHICAVLKSMSAPTFRARVQQLSATLTAKAVEDTAFYRYGRLLSRNEVGSDPGRMAIEPDVFHADCVRRRRDFPLAMLATATHDHKRGEDARMRLAVLSEIPEEWGRVVRPLLERDDPVEPAIRYMILQSIVGAWPLVFHPDDAAECAHLRERLEQWLTKALREAKQATSWAKPDAAFEERCKAFLHRMLDPGEKTFGLLAGFVGRIAPSGALNGLSQTLLRLTTPGMPDLYRGTEFWDFSLVDPDNRAPVDFAARRTALEAAPALSTLLADWRSGHVKQALVARLLDFRRSKPNLFMEGSYEPLAFTGKRAHNLVGFMRRTEEDALIVLAPRLSAAALGSGDQPSFPASFWEGTRATLPAAFAGAQAHDRLADRAVVCSATPYVREMLGELSSAVLHIAGR
jgi:(1->4)-alpha-D-glucan 1-alpha-D-glucosylmutase